MRHFNEQEWLDFHRNEANQEKEAPMEDHLLICDNCMEFFLSSIDENDIELASAIIPTDFNTSTFDYIQIQDLGCKSLSSSTKKKARLRRKRLFFYYIAAASVTLLLMSQGIFQSAINQAANMPAAFSHQTPSRQHDFLFNWPAQLRQKTSSWLGTLEWKNLKEVK